MTNTVWMLQDAKNRFCKLIDRVEEAPQIITKRGEAVAVVISYRNYRQQLSRKSSLLDFLKRSPLWGSGLEIEPRVVDSQSREVTL